jgi:glycine betaine/choline ABC-type transport system substrate-binding protein
LTIPAIQQMNKAVSIDKQSPASVAEQFVKANALAWASNAARVAR